MPVSGACLDRPVCRPRRASERFRADAAVDARPAVADHHNEITRLDSYGHIKAARTGVMLCLCFSGKTNTFGATMWQKK